MYGLSLFGTIKKKSDIELLLIDSVTVYAVALHISELI